MTAQWESGRVKAQLRLTAQRLGQLQDRMESQGQITQRDIATLLQQGNIALARAKTQKLMREDVRSDLLQTLEMHVGVILGHLNELERSDTPSPIIAEAASSIIYAGLSIESKDLHYVREFLMQVLGHDFTRSALENQDDYVSARVLRAVAAPPPTAAKLDQYLYGVARMHNVNWLPDLSPQQKVNTLSPIVDPEIVAVVDLAQLRSLCSHGLPSHPPWLRPRVWRLLLGTLPVDKGVWQKEARTQRDNYYDLVRRLLQPLSSLAEPTDPLSPSDQTILDVFNELSMVPPSLLVTLEDEPEPCPQCPLDGDAPEDVKVSCAGNLDARLRSIRAKEAGDSAEADPSSNDTPEIRLDATPEIRLDATPEVRLEEPSPTKSRAQDTIPETSLQVPDSPTSSHSGMSTTLLPSRPYTSLGAHNKHSSALLRLLYIHSCLNPANRSPQIGSLLVPIYAVLVEEVDPEDIPHVEADAFWVFESMVGEFSELEAEQNGTVWVQKLSDRLRWADPELADDLAIKGLDPGLPHYSFRWLVPLLTHTLPLPAVLMVWDALFSQPMRQRDENPKLDYLMDICTSMLLSARGTLLQLGRAHRKSQNLWSDEVAAIPSTTFGDRELEEAFIEGMAFLQRYPLESVGGIEKVLQTAFDLASQRESGTVPRTNGSAGGFGARLRDTVWKGFSSGLESHPEETDSEEEDEDDYESDRAGPQPGAQPTLTKRLANSVWRGITNQSAMEVPSPATSSSPSPVPSPLSSPLPSPLPTSQSAPAVPPREAVANAAAVGKSMLWGYAEKLKDSDAAANLAKVTTNWRVKALDAWTKRGNEPAANNTLAPPSPSYSAPSLASAQDHNRSISLTALTASSKAHDDKRGSLPIIERSDAYTPPPRPAFFRPVRDSVLVASPVSRSGDASPVSDTGSHRSSLRSSFKLPERNPSRTPTGPKPLLLSSSALMTGSPARSPVSPSTDAQWAEAVRAQRPAISHRASQSSISSLSPSEPFRATKRVESRSDMESDGGGQSRIVPLNRNKSPSPMARASRQMSPSARNRRSIDPPTPPKSHRRLPTESSAAEENGHPGWGRVDTGPDSPTTIPSPPPPGTPEADTTTIADVRVKRPESQRQRGSVVFSEGSDATFALPSTEGKLSRRSATLSRRVDSASSMEAPAAESKNPNLRRKRFPPRLQSLRNSRSSTEPMPPLPSLALGAGSSLDIPADYEHEATTPRAGSFDEQMPMPPSPRRRPRKVSSGEREGESTPGRTRKISTESRTRKNSGEGRRKVSAERDTQHRRESAAVEGDDEGYNDLLSAYESEDQ
ncbi:regulator of Vps4 activity in the MVB pathway-domain-containing protein [Daedaleopsis nitida]|nr:regulator of Vps4 activity in the MVB pathway-domain-containing protein [Daedaleopsis nitida]